MATFPDRSSRVWNLFNPDPGHLHKPSGQPPNHAVSPPPLCHFGWFPQIPTCGRHPGH